MHFCTACPVVRWPACSSGRGAAPQMARPGGARPAQSSRPYRSRALLRVCRPSGLPDDDMMAPPGQAFIAGLQQTTEPGRPSSPSHRPAGPTEHRLGAACFFVPLLAHAGEVADSVTPATVPLWCGCGMPNKCALSSDQRNQPATARIDRAAQNTRRTTGQVLGAAGRRCPSGRVMSVA